MDRATALEAFSHYASAQAAYGLALISLHRRNEDDRCVDCARPHPCARRRHGAELIIHFGQWSSSDLSAMPQRTVVVARPDVIERSGKALAIEGLSTAFGTNG